MAEESRSLFIVKLAKGIFYVCLLLAVVFVALTQTEVGREGVKSEVERQFDRQFEGSIEIGTLSGNLVQDLFATDVRLYDPDGVRIGTVDSVVARPSWRSIADGSYHLRSLILYRPDIQLVREDDLGWNIERALTPVGERSTNGTGTQSVDLPQTELVDGRITAMDGQEKPIFAGFSEAERLYVLQVHASGGISWNERDGLQLDLASLSADFPDLHQEIRSFEGGVRLDTAGLAISDAHLRLRESDLSLSGRWTQHGEDPHIEATFDAETLDFDELATFIPDLPLRNQAVASGHLVWNSDGFFLDDVHVSHEQSFVQATGHVRSTSDALAIDAEQLRTHLFPADARELFPGLGDLLDERTGILEGIASGELLLSRSSDEWQFQQLDLQLSASSGSGSAQGDLSIDVTAAEAWTYAADLETVDFNLGRVLPEFFPETHLTGTIAGNATGPLEDLYGRVATELENSSIGLYSFANVTLEAEADSGVVLGQSRLSEGMGTVITHGQIDLRNRSDSYYLSSQLYDFDLYNLVRHDSLHTAVTGSIEKRGSGFSLSNMHTVWNAELDSSRVMWGQGGTIVEPQQLEVTLASRFNSTQFGIEGDALRAQLESDASLTSVLRLSGKWGNIAAERLDYYFADTSQDTSTAAPPLEITEDFNLPESELSGQIDVRDSQLLASFFPAAPAFDTDLHLSIDGFLADNRIDLSGSYHSSHLQLEAVQTHALRGGFSVKAQSDDQLAPGFKTSIESQADSAWVDGRIFLRNPSINYEQESETGRLHATSASHRGAGPLRTSAAVQFEQGANRLILQDFSYETERQDWLLTESAPITFSRRHLAIPQLRLTGRSPDTVRDQFLSLEGIVSNAPDDTLIVAAHDLQISPTSGFSLLGRPVDGLLSGQFFLTGGLRSPVITGRMLVDHLSFDNRLLGQLTLHSTYQTGAPDVQIEASLRSTENIERLRLNPDVPELIPTDNELDLKGSLRLPSSEGPDSPPDRGAFDLDVDVHRAEVFIFEYIFQDLITETSGHLSGAGHIGGNFGRPVFNADLNAVDGSFSIPEFNLTYDLDGEFTVDRDGIQFNDVLLTDRKDGRATIGGRLEFNEFEYFSFNMEADLDRIQIIDVRSSRVLPFYGTIAASGPVFLTGPLHNAHLRGPAVRTSADSDLFIPVVDSPGETEEGFLIFADQDGQLPDLRTATQRRSVLSDRPLGERTFLDGLSMDLNVDAPQGSTVHLVFDALLGDVMTGQGSGQIQLQRQEGEFRTYGTFDVDSGEYLFTAGELFYRRFRIDEGTIHWDGNPVDAELDITASYRTRASAAGLSDMVSSSRGRIPLVVQMHIQDRVSQPSVDLSLAVDRSDRTLSEDYAATALETVLNQTERETEYATSVLLTNTFLLTTELEGGEEGRLTDTGNRLAFNSLSQLVGSQLNRYLNEVLPNVDLVLDVHGENPQNLDVIYGVALRLLDERLIIRGEGVWTDNERRAAEGMEGEFIVELRFSPTISIEAFHRREGNLLAEQVLTSTTGAGVSYETQFPTWREFIYRLFGWELPEPVATEDEDSTIATRE